MTYERVGGVVQMQGNFDYRPMMCYAKIRRRMNVRRKRFYICTEAMNQQTWRRNDELQQPFDGRFT